MTPQLTPENDKLTALLTLGHILKRGRVISQLTLRQVEEATGISNAYLSQLENDKIKKPSATVLYKLSSIYRLSLDELFVTCGKAISPVSKNDILHNIRQQQELTPEEEHRLLEYLHFLRFNKTKIQ